MAKPKDKDKDKDGGIITCIPVFLPDDQVIASAKQAIEINPANRPSTELLTAALTAAVVSAGMDPDETEESDIHPDFLAMLTSKYWGAGGVDLSVGFMESTSAELRDRILSHMNAWGDFCKVKFSWTSNIGNAQVRITRAGNGYWSYLGTDILGIPRNQPTMCLQNFSMNTPESEYKRVVRHETGHTLGCSHEHLRREIINRLDPNKTINWGARVLGWDSRSVREQILTPLDENSIMGTTNADALSIMCYQLPAEVTRDGHAIPGGLDFDAVDREFAGKLYPLPDAPSPPEPHPPEAGVELRLSANLPAGRYAVMPIVSDNQSENQEKEDESAE